MGNETVAVSRDESDRVGTPRDESDRSRGLAPDLRARVRRRGSSRALAAAQEAIALTAGASDGVVGIALAVAAVLVAPSDRAAALSYLQDLLEHFREVGVVQDLALAVWFGARVMATIGEAETAAVLVGIWDSSVAWLHWTAPVDQELPLAELRAALGNDAVRQLGRTRPRLDIRRVDRVRVRRGR